MNEEIKTQLVQVLQALNSISVSGRANLANLAGSISVLEDILRQISQKEE